MFGELLKFPEHGVRNETIFRSRKHALPLRLPRFMYKALPSHEIKTKAPSV